MRSTRMILALTLLLCVWNNLAAESFSNINLRHSINVTFPDSIAPSTSRYNLEATLDSGDLVFNISTLREGQTHHHAHIRAVPYYNNSETSWSSSVHMAHYSENGQESRIHRFVISNLTRKLNNYGPGPCEKISPLETVCRFNFSVAHKWLPVFVCIRGFGQDEQFSLKIFGTHSSSLGESPELSWSQYWRVNDLIKKADLHVLYNEPKAIMELKWNNTFNGSNAFKELKPAKISFQSENLNVTKAWQHLSTLKPTTYLFLSKYGLDEKICESWCNITVILSDSSSFYPVQILKYRNPNTFHNFLIVGGFLAFACLVVFVCWISRKRRNMRRSLAQLSQFNEISKVPANHYVVYHAAQAPQQPFRPHAQNPLLVHQFSKQ